MFLLLVALLILARPDNLLAITKKLDGGIVSLSRDDHTLYIFLTPSPGHTTYATNPGPLGFPPQLIFNNDALNLEGSKPERLFLSSGGSYLGYRNQAILRTSLPVLEGRLDFYVGFCAELCIPHHLVLDIGDLHGEQISSAPFVGAEQIVQDQPWPLESVQEFLTNVQDVQEVFIAHPVGYSDLYISVHDIGSKAKWLDFGADAPHQIEKLGVLLKNKWFFIDVALEN